MDSLYKVIMADFPDLFEKNGSGNPYVRGGVYCPVGWEKLVYNTLEYINYHVNNVIRSKENEKYKGFYKLYDKFWMPFYNWSYQVSNYNLRKVLVRLNAKLQKNRPRYIKAPKLNVKIHQIKEKFGELRIYTSGSNEEINGVIDFVRRMSTNTCEVTGKSGNLCVNSHGCYKTLSPDIAKEMNYIKV